MKTVLQILNDPAKVQQAESLFECLRFDGEYAFSLLLLTDAPVVDVKAYLAAQELRSASIALYTMMAATSGRKDYVTAILAYNWRSTQVAQEALKKEKGSIFGYALSSPGGLVFLRWLEKTLGPLEGEDLAHFLYNAALLGQVPVLQHFMPEKGEILEMAGRGSIFDAPLISAHRRSVACLKLLLPLARRSPEVFGNAMFLAVWRTDIPYRIRRFFKEQARPEDFDVVLARLKEHIRETKNVNRVLNILLAWGCDPAKVEEIRTAVQAHKARKAA